MSFHSNRRLKYLTGSISVLVIGTGLVVASQYTAQKSLAQTTPLEVDGAGTSIVTTLFVGTGANNSYPFGSKGSWFNVYGVGNPPSLNDDVPPAFLNYPNGTYGPVNSSVTFRYASVGSDKGINTFICQRPSDVNLPKIDFAATDEPLANPETERCGNLSSNPIGVLGTIPNSGPIIQVPIIGVGIAVAFNPSSLTIPSAGLKLSRKSYCGIFNGKITNWNDPSIKVDNGGATISLNKPIVVVLSSDDSGTFALSNHLNAACQTAATPGLPAAYVWNRGVGKKSTVEPIPNPKAPDTVYWPTTFKIGNINTTSGAIGYVNNATRVANALPAALLQNKANATATPQPSTIAYVGPTTTGIKHALAGAVVVKYGTNPNNRLIRLDNLQDPTSTTAYPIVAVTYFLAYDIYGNAQTANAIKGFINWTLANANSPADQIAISRGYAPLADAIKGVSRTVVNMCVNTVYGPSPCIP